MSGLVLKLGPSERLLINGAVIENGPRRARLNILTAGASILRLRDALHPDEVNTPVARLCYATQLVLTGDTPLDDCSEQLLAEIDRIAFALRDTQSHAALSEARSAIEVGNAYRALRSMRSLLETEARLLALAAQ